ncbi:hypothetical protein [Kordiimonas sp.]|uniref:hypothetical protein n=1 Tax=Kordiimonas sp. TaxID=1970157 RepID=UPI003B520401
MSDLFDQLLPPAVDLSDVIADPQGHFTARRDGWFRIWFKTRTSPAWCSLRCVGEVVLKRYQQLIERNAVRNILIERIERHAPGYRPGAPIEKSTRLASWHGQRQRKYLSEKGI